MSSMETDIGHTAKTVRNALNSYEKILLVQERRMKEEHLRKKSKSGPLKGNKGTLIHNFLTKK